MLNFVENVFVNLALCMVAALIVGGLFAAMMYFEEKYNYRD